MKANETPEKIYLHHNHKGDIGAGWLVFPLTNDDIEYVRTDYAEKEFIIKAERFLSEIHRVCDITDENGYRIELRELKARFEKYMKGE